MKLGKLGTIVKEQVFPECQYLMIFESNFPMIYKRGER
jgi:hypothetical protein